ncbi:transcription factor ATOH1 [Drosophila tropicalis]|uniref:transcription factor ATOH1 n=1 Tax=Drosophila tropicalis TaxID=46794 RepID=UPI0035AB8084
MPRKKRAPSPMEMFDDDFDEDASSQSSQPPVQRNAANARERMRMRVLSSAYGRLKTKLPNIPPDTKLSKLDTLRLATLYIKQLITAVETGSSHNHNHHQHHHPHHRHHHTSSSPRADGLDTNHLTDCGGGAGGAISGTFSHFHNGGHSGGMSWPFEFHQSNRNNMVSFNSSSSSSTASNSSRLDWQSQAPQSYAKVQRNEPHSEYVHLQQAQNPIQPSLGQWYPTDMQLDLDQACGYEAPGGQQHHHQRPNHVHTL